MGISLSSTLGAGTDFLEKNLSTSDIFGTAPSVESFDPFSEQQRAQREALMASLAGDVGRTDFNTGTSQSFEAAQLRDPNAQFQSFENVSDQLQVIQHQGLRSLNEGLAQSRGGFGGSALI